MREYRGDNYKELIPEIMSIMNITNYLHNEFKNRRDYYSARFAVTKDATYTATFEQDLYLELDKTSLTFRTVGGTQTVKVTSNVNWTVS